MAVELKDVFEFLGYKPEDIKTIDDLKTNFDKEFVRAKNITEDSEFVKPILGKYFGTQENELKKIGKKLDLEIDYDAPEFKDIKGIGKKFEFIASKYDEKKNLVIDELKASAGKGNDDKIKDWEKKYEKIKKSKEDAENLLNGVKTEYETYKQTTAGEIKNVKLNVLKKDALSKIKFKPDISDFEKRGYLSTIEEKYQFDIDENDTLVPMDKKGNKIPSTKVTGTFKTAEDILQEEAIAGKLYVLNPDAGKPKPNAFMQSNIQQQQNNGKPARQVAPRMA